MVIRIGIKVRIKESKIMMIGIKIMRVMRVKMKMRVKRSIKRKRVVRMRAIIMKVIVIGIKIGMVVGRILYERVRTGI